MNSTQDWHPADGSASGGASSAPTPDDPRVVRALQEYLTALEGGRNPNWLAIGYTAPGAVERAWHRHPDDARILPMRPSAELSLDADVSLAQWLAFTPRELVKAHLKIDDSVVSKVSTQKTPVVAS